MGASFGLIFAKELMDEQFADLVHAVGGTVDPTRPGKGTVSIGHSHAWLFLSNEELKDFVEDRREKEDIVNKLGAEPRALIMAELGSSPGNRSVFRLVVERLVVTHQFVIEDSGYGVGEGIFKPQDWLDALPLGGPT